MGGGSTVSAAEVIRNFGLWQERALTGPVTITHHGRARTILLSAEDYAALTLQSGGARPPAGEAAERLAALLDHLCEGFLAFDAGLRITAANRAAEGFLGVSRAGLMGLSLEAVIAEDKATVFRERALRVIRTGEPACFEIAGVIVPGRRFEVRLFPYDGGLGLLLLNLTEQERLRARAAEGDAWREAARAHPGLGLAWLDLRGGFEGVSEGFARIAGFTAEELKPWKLFDLLCPPDKRRTQDAFERVGALGAAMTVRARLMAKNGEERLLDFSFAALKRDFAAEGVIAACTPAIERAAIAA